MFKLKVVLTCTAVVKHVIHLIILAIVRVAQVSDVAHVSLNVLMMISHYSNVSM